MLSLVRSNIIGCICTRSVSYGHFENKKSARMLDKMIKNSIVRKKVVNTTPRKVKQEVLASAYDNEASNRKIAALNKLYMEQLIELINCGPFGRRLAELGVEFSKVNMTRCRSSINMYWFSNKPGISREPEVAEVLTNLKKELQAQMGFIKYMRKIPFISFTKDLRLERENNVENLLEVADFGKDVQRTNPRKVVRPDSNELLKIRNAENIQMRENVLGLDHAKVKAKIMQNLRRFQAINIKKNEVEEAEQYENPGKLIVFSKKLFERFYSRKQYLDRKLRKREYASIYVEPEAYDPENEADKYWEFHKYKDNMFELEEHELQDNVNLYEDYTEENNDNFSVDIKNPKENINGNKELEKEKFTEEKNNELFSGRKT